MTTESQIKKIIKHWHPSSQLKNLERCSWGLINENCVVNIKKPNRSLVIRVYPKDGWKAKKEEILYDLVRRKKVPIPKVFYCDSTKKIIPKPYLIMSYVDGDIGCNVSKLKKKTLRDLGKYLARIHSIKLKSYGWIIGNKIKPSFRKWEDFMNYDFKRKLSNISKYPIGYKQIKLMRGYYKDNSEVLKIKEKPCLLHKDYHLQNIFIKKNKVAGIIDFEWAVGGHNELDIAKSSLFMFEKNPKLKNEFMKGYMEVGRISSEFKEREKIYKFVTIVGNLSLALRLKNKNAVVQNRDRLKRILN
ncbi:aminoglycoside phosphotransferase family protein [Nanoarchaeota archaeon]